MGVGGRPKPGLAADSLVQVLSRPMEVGLKHQVRKLGLNSVPVKR